MAEKDKGTSLSRRGFMKTTGALGAGAFLSQNLTSSPKTVEAQSSRIREPRTGPLQTYLTFSDDPVTTMDVNLCLQRKDAESAMVYYDTVSRGGDKDAYTMSCKAEHYQSLLELWDRRSLFRADLRGLKPGTTYYFIAGDEKYGFGEERSFRTLPGGDAPVRFLNGGDMNVGPRAEKLLQYAGQQDADFLVIGGDLPYVNGLYFDYWKWIKWFQLQDKLLHTGGRMVPLVTAIGNHETNSFASDDLFMRSPFYMTYFGRQNQGPESVYHSHKFGDNIALIMLDSGHLIPHAGEQAQWLEQELEKYKDVKYKFAAYHVPLYPAYRPFDGSPSVAAREHWLPLFDKYGLTVGLEHHDHVFKRTKPLKGNQVVAEGEGTVYIGDGTFGVDPRKMDDKPLHWYNEKQSGTAHFWVIDANKDGLELKAIDENGVEIDRFSL